MYVDYMDHISTVAIMSLLRANPLLREVTLGCYSYEEGDEEGQGDALLKVVSTFCPQLENLNIFELVDYTEAGVYAVIEACPQLRTLVVDPDCTVISPMSHLLLKKFKPDMKIKNEDVFAPVISQYFLKPEVGTEMQYEQDDDDEEDSEVESSEVESSEEESDD